MHHLALLDDQIGREQVLDTIKYCWKSLKVYGRKPEDFADVAQAFLAFLGSYPAKDVLYAFKHYARNREEFPTPSDIVAILEGRIKRDAVYYKKLRDEAQKKGRYALNSEEHNYIMSYEQQVQEDWE